MGDLVPVMHDKQGRFIGTVAGRAEATSNYNHEWCQHRGLPIPSLKEVVDDAGRRSFVWEQDDVEFQRTSDLRFALNRQNEGEEAALAYDEAYKNFESNGPLAFAHATGPRTVTVILIRPIGLGSRLKTVSFSRFSIVQSFVNAGMVWFYRLLSGSVPIFNKSFGFSLRLVLSMTCFL